MSETSQNEPNLTTGPKTEPPATPISELVADPDFPKSAVGAKVDIKGFIGVVTEIVNNSIKVRPAAGNTVSYNFNTLRRLYGPRQAPELWPAKEPPPTPPASKPEPKRDIVLEPNFDSPLVPIVALVQRPDFPKSALGVFVDLDGFSGVVIELAGHSLKVRSRQGSTRSYNADVLRKQWTPARKP